MTTNSPTSTTPAPTQRIEHAPAAPRAWSPARWLCMATGCRVLATHGWVCSRHQVLAR